MTTAQAIPASVFADARLMHESSLERMAAGDIRDAAEKAWRATMRATEALVLARTGQQPHPSTSAGRRLVAIAREDPSAENLMLHYSHRQTWLHGECFYHEHCPPEVIEPLIHATAGYIRDAERLAGA